jgi:hypothetical protein
MKATAKTAGYVYAAQDRHFERFKIGITHFDPAKRLGQHRTSNPDFEYYRRIATDNPRAAEAFLKARFASKRVPDTTEWFFVSPEEIDEAFNAIDAFLARCLLPRQEGQLKLFKKQESNGTLLEASEDHMLVYERCREIDNLIGPLVLEMKYLKNFLMFEVGLNEGIEGLCEWPSQVQLRLNSQLVKARYPDVWEECRRPMVVRKLHLLD